jgi:glycosyltransferase involved in cell wall biosynthesis
VNNRASEMQVSVVIPVYNAADSLRELVARLVAVLDRLGNPYELILVDDGSRDDSWEVLKDLQRSHPNQVVAIQLMRNYGQHNALMCGFRHASGDYIVTMDDDLQHPPEEVPKLLAAIQESNLDLVYGLYKEKKHNPLRNLASTTMGAFYRAVFSSPVKTSSFRVMTRELMESIFSYSLNFTFIDGLLAWNTQRIGEISIDHCASAIGRSSYSFRKLVILALNMFTNFSLIPLQVMSAVGALVAGGGFVAALYYLYQYLSTGIPVPGYASIIVSVLVLGGLQLLALGIMGEYIGRLHLNVNRKPQYSVREVRRGFASHESEEDAAVVAIAGAGKQQT